MNFEWFRSRRFEGDLLSERDAVKNRIARDILRYFLRNPHSADTLEGIARWRLPDEAILSTLHETNEALKWLVATGMVKQNRSFATDPVYELNPDRIIDVKRFVDSAEETSK